MNILVKATLTLLFIDSFLMLNAQSFKGTIKGKIADQVTKQTLPGVTVLLDGTQVGTTTDTAGIFELKAIQEGIHFLEVSYIGYQDKRIQDIRVTRNKISYLEIEVVESKVMLNEVTVNAYKYENSPLTPVSTYSFSRDEISRNPGSQGDIFRAIGMLPGVSSSGGQYSAIAVRGQGTRDNVYIVDDIPVTELGHLEGGSGGFNDPNGGRFSIFAPRVVDNAQFQGGGFSAQYGRRSASFLGLGIKEGNNEDATLDGQLDLLGVTVNYDGPSHIQKNTSLFVSARYQDFRALINVIGLKDVGVPRFGDFIIKSTTALNRKNKLSMVAIVSPEKYTRTVDNVREDKELNSLDITTASNTKTILGLNLRTLTSKNSYWKNIIFYTKTKADNQSGKAFPETDAEGHLIATETIGYESDLQDIKYSEAALGYRSIYTQNFASSAVLTAGADVARVSLVNERRLSHTDTSYVFTSRDPRPDPFTYYTTTEPAFFNADFKDASWNISLYTDYSFLLFKKLTLNAGLRYDYTGFAAQHTLSPRLSGSYQLNATNSVNFATGIYYQDPVYSEVADQPADKKLKAQKVTQYILGYKKHFTPDLKLTIEGWYKEFDKMIVRPVAGYSEQQNAGTGWAGGFDINLTKRLTRKIHGQVGYSYMQSKRNDGDGLGEYDFDFSQPHQVNVMISYKFDDHWIVSSKFRYATGKPADRYEVHADVFNDPAYRRFSQEVLANNTDRLPAFISLDIRVNYRRQFNRLGLTTFVDIVNVLNRENANDLRFNPISGKTYYDGLAIFPTFGLKFEY